MRNIGYTFLEINGIITLEPYPEYEYIYGIFVSFSAILGSIISCEIAERTGRLKSFHLANILNIIGCVLCALGWKFNLITLYLIGRCMKGLVLGMFAFVVPLYSTFYTVREMVPLEHTGLFGAFTQVMNTFGNLCGAGLSTYLGEFVTEDLLFIIFLIPIVFSLIQTCLILKFYNFESPSYLWINNLKKEAFILINKLYINTSVLDTHSIHKNSTVRSIEDLCEDEVENESEGEIHSVPTYKTVLFSPNYRKSLLIACGLGLFKTLIGIDFFIILLDHNLSYEPHPEGYDNSAKMLVYLVNFLGACVAICYIDSKNYAEIGRVRLLRIGAIVMFLILFCIAIHRIVENYIYITALISSFVFVYEATIGTVL